MDTKHDVTNTTKVWFVYDHTGTSTIQSLPREFDFDAILWCMVPVPYVRVIYLHIDKFQILPVLSTIEKYGIVEIPYHSCCNCRNKNPEKRCTSKSILVVTFGRFMMASGFFVAHFEPIINQEAKEEITNQAGLLYVFNAFN